MKKITLTQALIIVFAVSLLIACVPPADSLAGTEWEIYPIAPRVGETVTFNTTRSNIWANETFGPVFYTYSWDFGDGTYAVGDTVTHTYANPGNYTVARNTTDNNGQWARSESLLVVNERTPIITYLWLSNERPFTGEEIIILGNLTDDTSRTGVANQTLQISWSTARWETWNEIGTVKTNDQGEFAFSWRPPENNRYQVRAVWPGNLTHPETSSSALLVVVPLGDLIVGFSSNSTITEMNFNQTTQLLTFTAYGPEGTSGYVNIMLKKTLDFNPQSIHVLIDNETVPHIIDSLDQNTLLLEIEYKHSTHSLVIAFNAHVQIPEFADQEGLKTPTGEPVQPTGVVASIVVMVVLSLGLLVYVKKFKYSNPFKAGSGA